MIILIKVNKIQDIGALSHILCNRSGTLLQVVAL